MTGRTKSIVFYGLNLCVLALIMTKTLGYLLPSGLATQVSHNSEAFWLAVLLGVAIQWVRPAARASRNPWLVAIAVAGAYLAIAVVLVQGSGHIDGSIVTLNESFFAAGLISIYLQLPRPVLVAPYLSAALLVAIVVFNATSFVTDQVEGLVAVMLAPISFDVADPTIIDPDAADRPRARAVWCGTLLLVPLVFIIGYRLHLSGIAAHVEDFGRRPTEAFIGLLQVHVFFSYVLRGCSVKAPGSITAVAEGTGDWPGVSSATSKKRG